MANRSDTVTLLDLLTNEFLARGGCVNVLKPRPIKYRPYKYMPVSAKRSTYNRPYDKPAGYRSVDYEQVGNNACGYSTKYVMGKEIK